MLRQRDLGHTDFFFFHTDFLKNCFCLVRDLGEGSRVAPVQWLQRDTQAETLIQGDAEELFKGRWAPEAPSHA